MVARVILTEPMLNAIGAALDERNKRLVSQLVRHGAEPKSQARDFAIECIQDAIRDGIAARLTIAAAIEDDDEFPGDITFVQMTEAESRALWGDR